MIAVTPPRTIEEIAQSLELLHKQSTEYWNSFPDREFFAAIGTAWSPAENARHLTKSMRPLIQAFKMPRFILRLIFGRARNSSRSYEQLRENYRAVLAAGGQAGKFAPTKQHKDDLAAWRTEIMDEREKVFRAFMAGMSRWGNADLDNYLLPHPLLGKLTVREMLFFTLYHNLHHIEVVERRLGR